MMNDCDKVRVALVEAQADINYERYTERLDKLKELLKVWVHTS